MTASFPISKRHYESRFILLIILVAIAPLLSAQGFLGLTGIPSTMASDDSFGSFWIDYDGDYDQDLFVVNDAGPNQLYRNDGGTLVEITTGVLVEDITNSWGATWGDYDNDGDPDVFVANWGTDSSKEVNHLYRNDGADMFTRMDSAGFAGDLAKSSGCAWADYDGDGWLDLFVSNGLRAANQQNYLYRGSPSGLFSRVDAGSLTSDMFRSSGCAWADFDQDGDQDLVVINENTNNTLYRNNGGIFSALTGPVSEDGGTSRGASWGDFDNDGDLDLYVTNWANENNFLYVNQDTGFVRQLSEVSAHGGRSEGSGWADYDNDGDLDLLVANWGLQTNFLYRNDGDSFVQITSDPATTDSGNSVGISWGDFDSDGYPDIYVAQIDRPSGQENLFYRNTYSGSHWLKVICEGVSSNRSGIGAKVAVKVKEDWQLREIQSQDGFGGHSGLRAHFGLGSDSITDQILISWPSGLFTFVENVNGDQLLMLTEPASAPDPEVFSIPAEEYEVSDWIGNRLDVHLLDPNFYAVEAILLGPSGKVADRLELDPWDRKFSLKIPEGEHRGTYTLQLLTNQGYYRSLIIRR